MNLFLRLVLTFIKARLSRQTAGLMDTTRIRSRVMLTDQDMFAHMTNSRYFSFSDLAIVNYILRTGAWKKLRKKGWSPVVCSETVVFATMLRAHQAFEVQTRLVGWTQAYLCFEHRFVHKNRETARIRIVSRFAARGREKVKIDDVIALLGVTQDSPPLNEEFRGMISDVEAARARRRESRYAAK